MRPTLRIALAASMLASFVCSTHAIAQSESVPKKYLNYARENQALGNHVSFEPSRGYSVKLSADQTRPFMEAAKTAGVQVRSVMEGDYEGPTAFLTGGELNKLKKSGLLRASYEEIIPGDTLFKFVGTAQDEIELRKTLGEFGHRSGKYGYGFFSNVWHPSVDIATAPTDATGYFSAKELVHLERAGLKTKSMFRRIGAKVAPVAVVAGVFGGSGPATASEIRMKPSEGSGTARLQESNVGSVTGFSSFEPSTQSNSGTTSR